MSILRFGERLWRDEVALDGLTTGEVPWDVAEEVADGVAVVPGFSNVMAFRTGDGLVLFDTGLALTAATMHRAVRAWCDEPLRYAVYSHGHIDHVGGMGPFDAESNAESGAGSGGPARPRVVAHDAVPARFRRYLATAGYNEIVNRRQFGLPELRWPTAYRYPDIVYRDSHTIRVGALTVELQHARGETDDHSWAYIPERDIICPGDLFIWNSPNCGNPQKVQRYPAEWAEALRAMAEVGAGMLLPSHGPPIVGAARVRTALSDTAEYLESLVAQTLELMNRGARLDEIIQTVRPPEELAGKPYLRAGYDEPEFVVRNIWRLYGGWWNGDPAQLKPAAEERVAEVLGELAGGADVLAARAVRALTEGEPRLAAHLAETALRSAPGSESARSAYRQVFTTLADASTSTMARGVYRAAAGDA
jgi:alkyl sulfatase BDS1-like metallo-beta-lactamase superfamily hydrolase